MIRVSTTQQLADILTKGIHLPQWVGRLCHIDPRREVGTFVRDV
jgi:hypothetical protein